MLGEVLKRRFETVVTCDDAREAIEMVAAREVASGILPYERLLGDAMKGDLTLFASEDAVEAAPRAQALA